MQDIEYYSENQFLPGNIRNVSNDELAHMKINSLNYRTDNFENIDWNNSIVLFGCSNVFGTGLKDNETIAYKLEEILQRPVINMGVPSSSIAYSVFNQIILASMNITPYAVINLWTSINRVSYFFEETPFHIGPWIEQRPGNNIINRSIKSLFDSWNISDSNPTLHCIFLQKMTEIMWKDTKHFQGTFFPNTSEALNVELFHYKDRAKDDDKHPGPLTAKEVAEQLALWCR